MFIDYMLTEKSNGASKTADKQCIIAHIKKIFPLSTERRIVFQAKNNIYELPYSISCTSATEGRCNDFVYSIHLEYESSNNWNCAQTLEKVHFAITRYFEKKQDYHLIIANDGLSEYYCNKAYPEFQKFERLLRNLIFIVVTKAYGERWVEESLPKELKPKIKREQLIESALTEMTLGELISYLFYGRTEVDFSDYIDNNYPTKKLSSMTKEELISIIEKGRPKSVWNSFLIAYIDVEQPKEKMDYLRDIRNKIAHCKQLYSDDYKQAMEYIHIFIPQIEQCIEKVSIKDKVTARDVIFGFGGFTVELSETIQQIRQMIAPAIAQMAEFSQSIVHTFRESIIDITNNTAIEFLRSFQDSTDSIRDSAYFSLIDEIRQIKSSLPTLPYIPLQPEDRQESYDESADADSDIETDEENENNGSDK